MSKPALSRIAKSLPQGPSKLQRILARLSRQPRLELQDVTRLKVRWNVDLNTYGANTFVENQLPRIRWANPSLEIEPDKVSEKEIKQKIELTFSSGQKRTIEMDGKPATVILQEVMDAAGGNPWLRYKEQREKQGRPILKNSEDEQGARQQPKPLSYYLTNPATS